ncbi:MAG: hypothetical protein IJK66_05130 [Bacilli bacterium]|nr:hypothetical protein [Bacilli bacterium]
MYYYNINKRNEIVVNKEDIKYSKASLINEFEKFINVCGFKLIDNGDVKTSPYEVNITKNKIIYKIIMYYKNITGAGWYNKLNIRRVQVTNVRKTDINKYISTSNNSFFAIFGYYNFDNNPIMVAWNAYNFVYHETTRSCYVSIELLIEGYKKGFIKTNYSKQQIWIFTPNNFEIFLNDYINCNKVNN